MPQAVKQPGFGDVINMIEKLDAKFDAAILELHNKLDGISSEMKADISEMKADISEMKADISYMKGDISELKTNLAKLEDHLKVRM
jgi:peptidoglycan hydrolase CwlO-like protein